MRLQASMAGMSSSEQARQMDTATSTPILIPLLSDYHFHFVPRTWLFAPGTRVSR